MHNVLPFASVEVFKVQLFNSLHPWANVFWTTSYLKMLTFLKVLQFVQLVSTAGTVAKVVTVKMVQHVIPEMASVFARQDILVIR